MLVPQLCPTLCDLPGSSVHEIPQARIPQWVSHSLLQGSSWLGVEPGSPAFQEDSLPSELPGKLNHMSQQGSHWGRTWKGRFAHSLNISWGCWPHPTCRVTGHSRKHLGKEDRNSFSSVLYLVAQLCLTLCDPMNCRPPGSSVLPWFSRQEYWSGWPCPPPGDLPNPRIKPRSPTLQEDSLPSEPPETSKDTGLGSFSLLQEIFWTQELKKPGSPALRVDSLPAELPGKPLLCLYPELNQDFIFTLLVKTLR